MQSYHHDHFRVFVWTDESNSNTGTCGHVSLPKTDKKTAPRQLIKYPDKCGKGLKGLLDYYIPVNQSD